MIFQQKIFWLLTGIFLAATAEAQQHHFTTPQVHVQVTEENLLVSNTGYPDHKWERVNPNRPTRQNFKFQIPRFPKIAPGTTPVLSKSPIAVAVNGVVIFGRRPGRENCD